MSEDDEAKKETLVFSTTDPSFLGMESCALLPKGDPKFVGFEDDAFLAMYAHATLESEIGFDIVFPIDGTLRNVPEQPAVVRDDKGRQWEAVALLAKRPDDYGFPVRPRYLLYVELGQDVEGTRELVARHAKDP